MNGRLRRLIGAYPDTHRRAHRPMSEPELRYFAALACRRPQAILRAIVAEMGGLSPN